MKNGDWFGRGKQYSQLPLKMNGRKVNYTIVGTILEVELKKTIKPGESVTFDMDFEAQVPIQIRRSGRNSKEGSNVNKIIHYKPTKIQPCAKMPINHRIQGCQIKHPFILKDLFYPKIFCLHLIQSQKAILLFHKMKQG